MLPSSSLSLPPLHPSANFQFLPQRIPETRKPKNPTFNPPKSLLKRLKVLTFRSSLQTPELHPSDPTTFRTLNPKSIAASLRSCSAINEVKSVHAVSIRSHLISLTYVCNNLISGYLRFRSLSNAKNLFDAMPERNVVTWTAVLSGYLKHGLDDEVIEMFARLVGSSVQANSVTYVCLLKSCANRSDFDLGRQIHACVVKGNWSNLIVESALVYFYAQCGDLLCAQRVFDRMQVRDVVSWTAIITSLAQQGHGDEALSMFSTMQRLALRPNEFTVCSVLKACCEENAVRFGRQLHGAIAKGIFREDVVVGSALVTMYAKCGDVSDARLVFDLTPKRNTVTWTSMISGYARNGQGEEAISLYRWMMRRNVSANNLTVVSILTACGSIGSLSLGKEVHGQILKKLDQSNIQLDSTLIWFYCKCGEFSYATRILESMPERDAISWTAMISGHNSLEDGLDSLRFLNQMLWEGVELTPFTYSSALKACAKGEEVRFGRYIHGSANKTSASSNVFVASALISMYMKCGCVKDAFRVFETMPQRNLVSWKAMIVGYAKNKHCQDALKLMYRMRAEGFDVDDFVLAAVLSSCGDFEWESEKSSASQVEIYAGFKLKQQ